MFLYSLTQLKPKSLLFYQNEMTNIKKRREKGEKGKKDKKESLLSTVPEHRRFWE